MWNHDLRYISHVGLHLGCYLPKECHATKLSMKKIITANIWLLRSRILCSSKKGGCAIIRGCAIFGRNTEDAFTIIQV